MQPNVPKSKKNKITKRREFILHDVHVFNFYWGHKTCLTFFVSIWENTTLIRPHTWQLAFAVVTEIEGAGGLTRALFNWKKNQPSNIVIAHAEEIYAQTKALGTFI